MGKKYLQFYAEKLYLFGLVQTALLDQTEMMLRHTCIRGVAMFTQKHICVYTFGPKIWEDSITILMDS